VGSRSEDRSYAFLIQGTLTNMTSHLPKNSALPKGQRSAASPWKGDRPPHLPCRRGELPTAVFFPGDPGRVDRFASVLDDFRILGQNREFRMGVGSYQGVGLGVCSTGIGGPSTEIALVEAAELGCKVALRVGGTGVLDSAIPLGSLLVVEEALRGGGAASLYAPPNHPARPHPSMLGALLHCIHDSGIPYHEGKVASIDGYYSGQGRPFPNGSDDVDLVLNDYRRKGVSALDMEAESILIIGEYIGLISGVLLTVHANRGNDTWLEDYEPAQDRMIRLACQAMLYVTRNS
jgi:uridine phosphorylase